MNQRSAAEAARSIASALEHAGIPYAIGGALALAIAGVPRGTADVDLNVFVGEEQVSEVVGVLQSLGIDAHLQTAIARAKGEGMFVANWDGMRIDVFLPSIDFAHEAGRTRIQVTDQDELNVQYVREWIVDMMGLTDERVIKWDEIVAKYRT